MPWQWLWPMLLPASELAIVEDQCVETNTCTGP
jgi:hypothetical protein